MNAPEPLAQAWARALTGRARDAIMSTLLASDAPPAGREPPRLRSRVPAIGTTLALLIDPVEFQRTGHAALGEVFTTSLFGLELTFVGGADNLARFVTAGDEELTLVAAYRKMLGRMLGEEIFIDIPVDVLRALSGGSVRRRSGALAEFAEEFLYTRLRGEQEVDAIALANAIVMHMTCRFICGDFIREERLDELARLFHVIESDYSVIGLFTPLETPAVRRRRAAQARVLAIFEEEVRRAATESAPDPDGYMHAVLKTTLGPEPARARPEQLRAAALAVMGVVFGAHTNTAISLATILLDLIDHPRVLAEVRDEVDAVLAEQPFDLRALSQMPALLRAINESLRLRGGGGLWRLTRVPVELGGRTVPAGSLVGTAMGLLNLDPGLYPEPRRYLPERYREHETDDFQSPSLKHRRYGAFGLGRHVCPGRGLAYVMLGAALSALLREHEFAVVQRPRRWLNLFTAGVARPIGGMRLRVAPRSS